MLEARYFVVGDIEGPHPSFFSAVDENTRKAGFGAKWAWSDDGTPPEDALCWRTAEEAEQVVADLAERWSHSIWNIRVFPHILDVGTLVDVEGSDG